jgi:hypothetical protein
MLRTYPSSAIVCNRNIGLSLKEFRIKRFTNQLINSKIDQSYFPRNLYSLKEISLLLDCQPNAPATLYPQEDSWYSFLLEDESTPGS